MQRKHRDRGAVMVEMAIVAPILIALIFGMLEFGLAFKDRLAMSHAVDRAARYATVAGNDATADIDILNGFRQGLSAATSIDAVNYIDIYRADANGNPQIWDRYVPDSSACGWSPCPDPDDPTGPVYGVPSNYPPCMRDTVFNTTDGVDTIGVLVNYDHGWITGVLGFGDAVWQDSAEARMEPKTFGDTDPSC